MATSQMQHSPAINPETLLDFVSSILAPKSPTLPLPPPQRWDRFIRQALDRVLGPSPDPWHFGPSPLPWSEREALSSRPPPLPWQSITSNIAESGLISPRYRFLLALSAELIDRAELLHDLVASAGDGERGIIVVGGYVSMFVDDFCGNGFRPSWLRPGPAPPWWFEQLTAADLFVLGSEFAQAAKQSFDENLKATLASAASKFATVGASRLNNE